jgi:tetratricopeptide (TPR) repeat protein
MLASGLMSSIPVVGVSGIVFGLLGAVLWLEFGYAASLPAWWRVPRRGLYWMLGISALLTLVPFIAGAAHVGGLLGGGAAAAALTWRSLGQRRPSPAAVRAFAGASLAVSAIAIGTAAWLAANPAEYIVRHAERLLALEGATPDDLNNVAWILAVDPASDERALELALGLAERAVEETDHSEPHILDTLAEVYFQLGDREGALRAIEEAIQQRPDRDYYREQKRRFLGEREPEDRPFFDPREEVVPEEEEAPEEPGLSI